MSAFPLTALRPLAFPSHAWAALVCLRTRRVLALVPTAERSSVPTRPLSATPVAKQLADPADAPADTLSPLSAA